MEARPKTETAELINRYVDQSFVYRFKNGPDVVDSYDTARRLGLNCVALAHLVIAEMHGEKLPTDLDCYEMFTNNTYFARTDKPEPGALVWFGVDDNSTEGFQPLYDGKNLVNWREFPLRHVGICLGGGENPPVLHATYITGTNSVWDLRQFGQKERYSTILGFSVLKGVE